MSSSTIVAVQELLRKRMTADFDDSSSKLYGYESQKRDLSEVLKRTVSVGESNSLIIIGPRGCGKTILLRTVLKEIDESSSSIDVVRVSLNGLLQTDDRIAIKEITRQLQLENAVGDRVFGSFAENLTFLLAALKSGNEQSKAIFFVLDEFDLFCDHHNQTLLYNLFDITQTEKTPIAVIGLTCRLDILELLEKRVKSRFSHRKIHILSNFTFDEYLDLLRSLLGLPRDFVDKEYASTWRKCLKELLQKKSVLDIVKKLYHFTKDVRTLKSFLMLPICKLHLTNPFPSVLHFAEAYEHISQNSKSLMLNGLSVLELCLVLAMRRLTEVYDGEPFNFEMIYKEYFKFASHRSTLLFDKEIVMKAFEHLMDLELVQVTDRSTSRIQKRYQLVTLVLEPSQIAEVTNIKGLPTDIKQWASSLVT